MLCCVWVIWLCSFGIIALCLGYVVGIVLVVVVYLFHLGWVTLVVDWFTWVWPSVRGDSSGVVLE